MQADIVEKKERKKERRKGRKKARKKAKEKKRERRKERKKEKGDKARKKEIKKEKKELEAGRGQPRAIQNNASIAALNLHGNLPANPTKERNLEVLLVIVCAPIKCFDKVEAAA